MQLQRYAAAQGRGAPKDWYDTAFVLLHNDMGGVQKAIDAVRHKFESRFMGVRTQLAELAANFAHRDSQGARAYADQIVLNNVSVDYEEALTQGMVAVEEFCSALSDGERAGCNQ